MPAKFCNQTPPTLLVLAVFAFLFQLLGRESSFKDDLPAFLPLNDDLVHIEMSGGAVAPGVYQINDALSLGSVINLAGLKTSPELFRTSTWSSPLQAGERIEIIEDDSNNKSLSRGWMSASHRVSMGIPLHPDHMSYDDWQFLPGIGEAMASKVELDRQKNGDFVSLQGLVRVKGIGLKSIEKWQIFFSDM